MSHEALMDKIWSQYSTESRKYIRYVETFLVSFILRGLADDSRENSKAAPIKARK